MIRSCVAALAFAVVVAGCGGGGEPTTSTGGNTGATGNTGTTGNTGNTGTTGNTGSTSNQIVVSDNQFTPPATTITRGTTVTWTWAPGGYSDHNVTFANANIGNSQNQTTGTFTRTFNTAGTFTYMCSIHGSGMSGQITVQ